MNLFHQQYLSSRDGWKLVPQGAFWGRGYWLRWEGARASWYFLCWAKCVWAGREYESNCKPTISFTATKFHLLHLNGHFRWFSVVIFFSFKIYFSWFFWPVSEQTKLLFFGGEISKRTPPVFCKYFEFPIDFQLLCCRLKKSQNCIQRWWVLTLTR